MPAWSRARAYGTWSCTRRPKRRSAARGPLVQRGEPDRAGVGRKRQSATCNVDDEGELARAPRTRGGQPAQGRTLGARYWKNSNVEEKHVNQAKRRIAKLDFIRRARTKKKGGGSGDRCPKGEKPLRFLINATNFLFFPTFRSAELEQARCCAMPAWKSPWPQMPHRGRSDKRGTVA